MLLGVKIGNSKVTIAKFNNPLDRNFSIVFEESKSNLNLQILSDLLHSFRGTDCIICSVIPSFTEFFEKNFKSFFKNFLIISSKLISGLNIMVKNPEKLGVDRITCSVAGYEKYKGNIAVIDTGTATTITVVTEKGEIIGGSIMPGLQMMNQALHEKTATLPLIQLNSKVKALGKDTESAIRSGIILGTSYALKGIINEMEKSIKLKLTPLLTGGNASLLSQFLTFSHYLEPYLVIEGMRLIYLKNIKN